MLPSSSVQGRNYHSLLAAAMFYNESFVGLVPYNQLWVLSHSILLITELRATPVCGGEGGEEGGRSV